MAAAAAMEGRSPHGIIGKDANAHPLSPPPPPPQLQPHSSSSEATIVVATSSGGEESGGSNGKGVFGVCFGDADAPRQWYE